MPPKKSKGQKMDLSSFLADTTTGNWADEMDDIPVAPVAKDPDAPRRGDPGYFESLPNRGESRYPSREEIPMPTRPPYTAYVGNLAFDAVEEDLEVFFSGAATNSIKVIRDHEQKPKGFGYVEFESLDGLKEALARTGESFGGRNVRISVAEPPKESGGRGGYGDEPTAADTATQWRRAGPMPARSPPQQGRTFGRYDSATSGFGGASGSGMPSDGADVDWTAARGSKFVARTPGEGPHSGGPFGGAGGFNRGPRESREPRESTGLDSLADIPSDWRSSRPARPQQPPAFEGRESFRGAPRGGFAEREVGLTGDAAGEESWGRGSRFKASEASAQRPGPGSRRESNIHPELEEKSDWRSGKKSSEPTPSGSAEPSPQPARKHLSLLPRTSPASSNKAEEESGSAKASPFGAARAVDTAAREQEAMERAQKREEERRAQLEAAKQKRIADAAAAKEKEQQQKEAAGSGLGLNTEAKRVHPSRQQNGANAAPNARPTNTNQQRDSFKREGPAAPGGPWRRASGDAQQHPSRTINTRQQPAQVEVDEDGFVVATGSAGRKAAAREHKVAQEQKDAAAASKPKFSFAAAAGVDDFLEDADEEDAGAGQVGDAQVDAAAQEEAGVEQATEGVKAVQI